MTSLPGDKVQILLRLTPQRSVRTVTVTGNDLVKTKKLTEVIKQTQGALLDMKVVNEDVNSIRKIYQDKGYYKTEVTADVVPAKDRHESTVTYRVVEELRYKIDDITFTGNTAFTAKELKKKVETKFSVWSLVFPANFYNFEQLKTDLDVLTELYTGKGYFDVKVSHDEKTGCTISANGKWVTLQVDIREGVAYKVASVNLLGAKRFPAEELLARPKNKKGVLLPNALMLEPGKAYDIQAERAMADRVRAKYDPEGYIDLKVYPRHLYDAAAHTVAISFEVIEGKPCTIRDILITGNQVTQDRVIRREIAANPGGINPEDKADGGKIRAAKQRLKNLNYFEDPIEITPMATERDDQKDLEVALKEKRTGNLMLGVGYSTDDSFVGMVEISQSNFDISNWPKFTGAGQRASLRLALGTQRQDVTLGFTEPWFMDRRLRLDWELYARERDQDYYTQTDMGTQVMLTKKLFENAPEESEEQYWNHSVGYRFDRAGLKEFDSGTATFITDQEGNYNNSTLIYRIQRMTIDDVKRPTRGSKVQFTSELSPQWLGSYSDIYRLNLIGTKFFPIKKCVLKLEAEAGVVDNLSGDQPVLFDRYFAGGQNSIRGFKRRQVGPVDVNDNPYGGESLLRGTVEFIYPIIDMIRGSVWTDFGNVWVDSYRQDPSDVNISIGVGLQLDLPIGPIRLDYGFPVVTKESDLGKSGRFHFGVNYVF